MVIRKMMKLWFLVFKNGKSGARITAMPRHPNGTRIDPGHRSNLTGKCKSAMPCNHQIDVTHIMPKQFDFSFKFRLGRIGPNSPQSEFETEIKLLRHYVGDVDLVVAGHCGFAFTRQIGPVTWINAGAIGMPGHCGDPRTRFAVLENQKPQFHHLSYDHYAASQACDAA